MDTRFNRYFFYSLNDKMAFVIVGYSAVDSTYVVDDTIKYLHEESRTFALMAGVSPDQVRSYQITRSSKYDQMRVYYAVTESAPEGSLTLRKDWTSMHSFLTG
jgi:hypothetical protein